MHTFSRLCTLCILFSVVHAAPYGGATQFRTFLTGSFSSALDYLTSGDILGAINPLVGQERCTVQMGYDYLFTQCVPYPSQFPIELMTTYPGADQTCAYYIEDFRYNIGGRDYPEQLRPGYKVPPWSVVMAQSVGFDFPSLIPTPWDWASQIASDAGNLVTPLPAGGAQLVSRTVCKSDDGIMRNLSLCQMQQYNNAAAQRAMAICQQPPISTYAAPWCKMCIAVEAPYMCKAGFTVYSPVETVDGKVKYAIDQARDCNMPCAVGTWLTCRNIPTSDDETCTYHVPRDIDFTATQFAVSWRKNVLTTYMDNINVVPNYDPPYNGQCFPCSAAYGVMHYGLTPRITVVMKDRVITQMSHRCPGGPAVPEECPLNQVALVDSSGYAKTCVCADSYFQNSKHNGACDFCPAGYYCTALFNNLGPDRQQLCPDGTYSAIGSSACTSCNKNDCPDPSQSRIRCMKLSSTAKSGPLLDFQTSDAICEDCSKCIELGYNKDDAVPCLNVATYDSIAFDESLTRAPYGGIDRAVP